MKTKNALLSVFLIFSVIGCRESIVTQPEDSFNKEGDFISGETINLCCLLADPGGELCQLNGLVIYEHQIVENPVGEDGPFLVSLTILMNSNICGVLNRVPASWTIRDQSEDEFYVGEDGIYLLNKVYKIGNRMDVVLVVQYLVTTEGVGIPNLWLQEIDRYTLNQ